jgi:hypothetical protein
VKLSVRFAALFAALFFWSEHSEARVFNFNSETFSAYFGGTFGSSSAGSSAFRSSSGADTQFDKSVQTAASGEAGLAIALSKFSLRLGVEYLLPRSLEGVIGSDASGTKLFDLNSDLSAWIPTISIEIQTYETASSRVLFGASYGIAFVGMDNEYQFTPSGQSAFGVGDYKESSKTQANMGQIYVGYEFHFADAVTAVLHAGARTLKASDFRSLKETNAISGQQTENGQIRDMNGDLRSVDLSGAFVGLNFRFYL